MAQPSGSPSELDRRDATKPLSRRVWPFVSFTVGAAFGFFVVAGPNALPFLIPLAAVSIVFPGTDRVVRLGSFLIGLGIAAALVVGGWLVQPCPSGGSCYGPSAALVVGALAAIAVAGVVTVLVRFWLPRTRWSGTD